VVGSGNKNFNNQYCLTAKQYASQFGFPFLADYELRGTPADVERVYQKLVETANQ
ncbi:class Ib ribonucleoside-diphosphate reductase assembly flavoprotein NrdI, partial [Enterococcus hirae]